MRVRDVLEKAQLPLVNGLLPKRAGTQKGQRELIDAFRDSAEEVAEELNRKDRTIEKLSLANQAQAEQIQQLLEETALLKTEVIRLRVSARLDRLGNLSEEDRLGILHEATGGFYLERPRLTQGPGPQGHAREAAPDENVPEDLPTGPVEA